MSRAVSKGHRGAGALALLMGGAGIAAATWVSGDHGWALGAVVIYAVLAIGAFAWAGRSGDMAAILRAGGDERQRGLDRDATAIASLVMTLVAIIGGIVELGRTGNPGVYGIFCVVSGFVYAASLFELRRRRS